MQQHDLSFIQTKIMNTGTALFFCEEQDALPFSAYIITALKADEEGCIWFFISKSWNRAVLFDYHFPVKLEFYKKGYPYAVTIEGNASLVDDKSMVRTFMQGLLGKSIEVKEEDMAGVLLVKVKMLKSDCRELITRKTYKPFRQVVSNIKNVRLPFHTQLQPSI